MLYRLHFTTYSFLRRRVYCRYYVFGSSWKSNKNRLETRHCIWNCDQRCGNKFCFSTFQNECYEVVSLLIYICQILFLINNLLFFLSLYYNMIYVPTSSANLWNKNMKTFTQHFAYNLWDESLLLIRSGVNRFFFAIEGYTKWYILKLSGNLFFLASELC